MKTLTLTFSILLGLSSVSLADTQAEINQTRAALILEAFNSMSEKLIEPLELSDIELGRVDGRVVVNKKAKFTYYVQIEQADNPHSKLTLIPMSTSRFTPTYYQTDAWWDAHKAEMDQAKREGKPAPKQDMNEVAAWLTEMKLSTDPDVLVITPEKNKVQRQGLNDFLLNVYLENFVENGKVVLYRGAEKPGEFAAWARGETPRGVRYWTPTANYAWRYARKNTEFFNLLVEGETPLFRYEIPVSDFKSMVQRKWRQLTLGTELTKNSHQIFDRNRYFGDHLYGSLPYMGVGPYGVEFELRSNRDGAQNMVKYYKRPATVSDLANDRIRVLQAAMTRMQKQAPEEFNDKYKAIFEKRIQTVQVEEAIIKALINGKSAVEIQNLMKSFNGKSELTMIDGFDFSSWVNKKTSTMATNKCSALFL